MRGIHIPSDELYAMLGFDALVIGIRGWEKMRAPKPEVYGEHT